MSSFDEVVLPHLAAAHRLARWLLRDEHDAEDAVQEASLRALRHFRTFDGGNARAWFLRIVRNTCYGRRRPGEGTTAAPFNEEFHSGEWPPSNPETILLRIDDAAWLTQALRRLPERLRRVLVLRELEGLSYRELADVLGIPIGTVMSRLSRGREALRGELTSPRPAEGEGWPCVAVTRAERAPWRSGRASVCRTAASSDSTRH
jgi:RNA polymerase sigma-70 factor (ECF subfamily)